MPPNISDGDFIEYIPGKQPLTSPLPSHENVLTFTFPDRFYLAFFSKTPKAQKGTIFFSVDNTLLYNAFHHDFGPFHVAHIFRFAKVLHDILGVPNPLLPILAMLMVCRTKIQMTRPLFFTRIIHRKQDQTQHSYSQHT